MNVRQHTFNTSTNTAIIPPLGGISNNLTTRFEETYILQKFVNDTLKNNQFATPLDGNGTSLNHGAYSYPAYAFFVFVFMSY